MWQWFNQSIYSFIHATLKFPYKDKANERLEARGLFPKSVVIDQVFRWALFAEPQRLLDVYTN